MTIKFLEEKMPAGCYYIGDPCYVIREDDKWNAFLKVVWATLDKTDEGIVEVDGHKVFVSSTNTGDGCYRDQYGIEYPVDAGMIAALPVALMSADAGKTPNGWTFAKPFKVGTTPGRWNKGGKYIRIGAISIRT